MLSPDRQQRIVSHTLNRKSANVNLAAGAGGDTKGHPWQDHRDGRRCAAPPGQCSKWPNTRALDTLMPHDGQARPGQPRSSLAGPRRAAYQSRLKLKHMAVGRPWSLASSPHGHTEQTGLVNEMFRIHATLSLNILYAFLIQIDHFHHAE